MGGYRISGTRAVRVDMLERLADMIRDRLFWKPRIPEEQRPAGSMEGGGFTVVPDMMSIVGCSGEDFQNILISLGYRSQISKFRNRFKLLNQRRKQLNQALKQSVAVEAASRSRDGSLAESAPIAEAAPVDAVPEPPPVPLPRTEMQDIAIWWPEGMGPFKARPPRVEKPATSPIKPFQKRDHEIAQKALRQESTRKPDRKLKTRVETKAPGKTNGPQFTFCRSGRTEGHHGEGS